MIASELRGGCRDSIHLLRKSYGKILELPIEAFLSIAPFDTIDITTKTKYTMELFEYQNSMLLQKLHPRS